MYCTGIFDFKSSHLTISFFKMFLRGYGFEEEQEGVHRKVMGEMS